MIRATSGPEIADMEDIVKANSKRCLELEHVLI
jgi:hypothetical protein